MKLWHDKPYYPISQHYRELFGEKVYKLSVSVADTCPNRLGLKNMETCVFCDEWGSAAYPEIREQNLKVQISQTLERIQKRYKAQKFLVYFQSYTNSFMGVQKLEEHYNTALEFPEVAGIVIGTRPDCLSPSLLKLWKKMNEKTHVSIELGVQTFREDLLRYLKRGHSHQTSLDAIQRIHNETGLDIGLHFIFGIPGETQEYIKQMAQETSQLPITNVKFHNLHVLKNTPLEDLYNKGEFSPLEFDEYSQRVIHFLQHLSPNIAVQRLSALSSKWEELIAPQWTRHKMKATQGIIDKMSQNMAFQGQFFK